MLMSRFADIPMAERASTGILDLAAGAGALPIPLAGAGFNVTPCDLFPEDLSGPMKTYAGMAFDEAWKNSTAAA